MEDSPEGALEQNEDGALKAEQGSASCQLVQNINNFDTWQARAGQYREKISDSTGGIRNCSTPRVAG